MLDFGFSHPFRTFFFDQSKQPQTQTNPTIIINKRLPARINRMRQQQHQEPITPHHRYEEEAYRCIPVHCRHCGKSESSDAPLSECGTCGSVVYCSFDCLKSDWPNHQSDCNLRAGKILLQALQASDEGTIQRLIRHKRVVNAQVTFEIPPPSDTEDDNVITSTTPSRSIHTWTTPLHECIKAYDITHATLLLQHGAKVDVVNDQGETPLLLAVTQWTETATRPSSSSSSTKQQQSAKLVRLLLQAGADPHKAAHNGRTASSLAHNYHDQAAQLVQLLQNRSHGIGSFTADAPPNK